MQKQILCSIFFIMMVNFLHVTAQNTTQNGTYSKYFIGSSLLLLGNLATVNKPDFVQLNLGYRLTKKDVFSVEIITWKTAWPLGINPIFNKAYGTTEEKFPGYVRDYGVGLAYQRFLWKGLYAAVHVMPMWQRFVDDNGNKIDNGFHLFNTNRIGYQVQLFKNNFFIEPSLGFAGRPYHTKMPDGFHQKDAQWPIYTFEFGLHFGYNL